MTWGSLSFPVLLFPVQMSDSYMTLWDWAILVVPVAFVMFMGFYSRRYVRGVSDFLVCGRVCGRYVLNMGEVAYAFSMIGLVTFVEIRYKTGFSLGFWGAVLTPLTLLLSLTGFVTYRFRETKAMSLGQFLEIRYSRPLRIFAAALRSLAEMIANMIMPSIAARFFIRMLNLPERLSVCGVGIPTFDALMILFLTLAVTLICFGGTLALVITDTLQGMILYPLLICFVVFILVKFSWSQEIIPVMQDRVAGESFLNPFDVGKFRDFNVFTMVIVVAFNMVVHRGTWLGDGVSCAAKSAHEQKMAGLLASWRYSIINIFYLLVAICVIVFLNHRKYAPQANMVRQELAARAVADVLKGGKYDKTRERVRKVIAQSQPLVKQIGEGIPPLSQEDNLDVRFLEPIHQALKEDRRQAAQEAIQAHDTLPQGTQAAERQAQRDREALVEAEGEANDLFKQCRTLFHQLSLSVTMKALLPPGLFGAFALLLFLAMLSTDDSRIFSATLTIAQDCILPFFPKGLSPKQHVRMIRLVAMGIGVFFFFGSKYMSQLDYNQLFNQMAVAIWNAGCPAVMILGLYWKKGTTPAAWTSLGAGIAGSVCYILLSRYWADVVYPFLVNHDMVATVDSLFRNLSAPFGDWIHWEVNELRFPVNSIEYLFFANIFTILLYIAVSLCTCRKDFNMDRMLHRGAYEEPGEHKELKRDWRPRSVFRNIIGITPEYTRGDKAIAYGLFFHTFVVSFSLIFLGTLLWNLASPWGNRGWSNYFLINNLLIPCAIAACTSVWFTIGGVRDLRDLFRTLKRRKMLNVLDDGRVEGNVSLADLAEKDEGTGTGK